jgi:polar amino acid transport system substrate-binding protein
MLQSKVKRGSIVLPEPIRQSPSSAGVPNQADKSWRDWLGLSMDYLYQTGQTQKIFDEYLTYRGIDASKVPAIMRERWTKA